MGIDIGGTHFRVASANRRGKILKQGLFETHVEDGPEKVIERLVETSQTMLPKRRRIRAVGVSCAGPLNPETGVIQSPPNMPGWDNIPLKEKLEHAFHAPAYIDNDANMGALGEHTFGAGREFKDMVYMTVSTGIGGGIIVDGKLLHGMGNGAGEIGHQRIMEHGPRCGCGADGCLEALASGTAIGKRATEGLLTSTKESSLRPVLEEKGKLTGRQVIDAAKEGDPYAKDIWDQTTTYLALGIGNILTTLSPQAIVIGGGVSQAGDMLFGELRKKVFENNAKLVPVKDIPILPAQLEPYGPLYGAIALAMQKRRARK